MKLKVKMLKRMISIVCALSISASALGTSVSAIKAPQNASDGVVNGVNGLNNILGQYRDSLNAVANNIANLANNENNSEETQVKLAELMSMLESSKVELDKLDGSIVADINFVAEIRNTLENISLNIFDLSEKSADINELNAMNVCAKNVFTQLEKINKEVVERANDNNFVPQGENFEQKLDSIHNRQGINLDEKFEMEIEFLLDSYPEANVDRLKVALNMIRKYNYDGEKRQAIMELCVTPVLREEAKRSFDKCCNEGGSLFVEELRQRVSMDDIEASLRAAENSGLNTFKELLDFVFDGQDGFYTKINAVKKQCYQRYKDTYDKKWSPVIADLALVDRMVDELENMLDTDDMDMARISKLFKKFSRIFSYREGDDVADDAGIDLEEIENPNMPEGMYGYLTDGRWYLNDIQKPQGIYVGPSPILNDFHEKFQELVDMLVTGRADDEDENEFRQKAHQNFEAVRAALVNINNEFTDKNNG